MYQRRRFGKRLHQIGTNGILEQCGHGPDRLYFARRDIFAVVGFADNNGGQPFFQVIYVFGQTQNRHNFAGNADIKAVAAGQAVGAAAHGDFNVTERPVVQVQTTAPANALWVDVQFVALFDMIVYHGCQQVVGGGNGVNVAGKVQVNVFHRHNLRIAAAGRAAFQSEAGAERRLAQRQHDFFAAELQSVGQTDGYCRFSLAGRGRSNRRDQNEFSFQRFGGQFVQLCKADFGLVPAVKFQVFFAKSGLFGNASNRFRLVLLRNFNV